MGIQYGSPIPDIFSKYLRLLLTFKLDVYSLKITAFESDPTNAILKPVQQYGAWFGYHRNATALYCVHQHVTSYMRPTMFANNIKRGLLHAQFQGSLFTAIRQIQQ